MNINLSDVSMLMCASCTEYMIPPIKTCEWGHSICHGCRVLEESCPECDQELTNVRNHHLEELARISHFPCSNSRYGCQENLPMNMILEHQRLCPVSTLCPHALIPADSCNWRGSISGVRNHLETVHRDEICNVNGVFFGEVPDMKEHGLYFKVMSAFNELFFCLWDTVPISRYRYRMFYIGPKRFSSNFINKLTLKSQDGAIHDSWYRKILPVTNPTTSHLVRSVCIPYSNLSTKKMAYPDKTMPFSVKIFRAPEE